MKQLKTLVFFGNERLLVGSKNDQTPIFDWLVNNGWEIKAVITSERPGQSRNYKPSSIIAKAKNLDIPVYNPSSSDELREVIKNHPSDLGLLVAYGKIVPQDIIDQFKTGIVNIHPSLLPLLRGSSPVESAMLSEEPTTGVSLMKLVSKMDAGPIFAQAEINKTPFISKDELYNKIIDSTINLLDKNLPLIAENKINPTLQDETKATYTVKINKEDGKLKCDLETAKDVEKKIRAYHNFPKPSVEYNGKTIIILSARVVNSDDPNQIVLQCKNDTNLCVDTIIAPNGKTMSSQDYLRGLANSKN